VIVDVKFDDMKKKTSPSWWRPLRRALAIAGVIVLVIL
jgi:hypothetical protein